MAQDNLPITWDYKDQTFNDFVLKTESLYKLRFFYKEDWVKELKPGNWPGLTSLTQLLDNLFKDRSLYYYFDGYGNVVITKDFAVKVSDVPVKDGSEFYCPYRFL